MLSRTFPLAAEDGVELFVYRWEPDGPAKAVVQITHGMVEHAGRYARTAEQLTLAGYAVYAHDQRGHGKTALTPGDLGYLADSRGFEHLVADVHSLNRRIAVDHPGLPIFLLGHSMGSFVTQHYLFTHGDTLAGAVLSGTTFGGSLLAKAGDVLGKAERLRLGPRGRSTLLQRTSFWNFNAAFKPRRTEFDWLSRDLDEVDKYVADPLCGFDFTVQAWIDLFGGLIALNRKENLKRVPRSLPIYLFSGDQDPVSAQTRGVKSLIDAYRRVGLTDVTSRFYPDARHETLNEKNRAEVHRDLIAWLDAALARRARS
jgi:alpha-beta hydrolase superfamily lysophospholipase